MMRRRFRLLPSHSLPLLLLLLLLSLLLLSLLLLSLLSLSLLLLSLLLLEAVPQERVGVGTSRGSSTKSTGTTPAPASADRPVEDTAMACAQARAAERK